MVVMKKDKKTVLLFVLPCLLVFALFGLAPLLPPIFYSFFDYRNMKVGDFIGIQNYVDVVKSSAVWTVLLNNLKLLVLQFLIGAPLSFLCAILITAQTPGVRRFFKTVSFLPYVLSVSVVCSAWSMMLQPQWGIVESIMKALGIGHLFRPWISIPETSFYVTIFTVIWQAIGYNMLLMYAGIKAIPESYFEAARIDGATLIQQVFHLTIPLLKETFKFVTILMVTGTLAMIANVQILLHGNLIGEKAYSTVFLLYNKAFGEMNFGFAYALTVLYAIVCFAVVLIVNKCFGKERMEYI